MNGRIVKALWMTGVILIISASALFAQGVPANTIMYQGKLVDDAGAPITSAVSVVFTIWSAPTGGTNLYDTTASITPDANGLFAIELGPLSSTILDGTKRYLGIKVGSDAEMTPRQVLTAAPASFTVANSPGIVFKTRFPSNSFDSLTSTSTAYDSITIYAPGPGYIHVSTHCVVQISHTNGTQDDFQISIDALKNTISYNNYSFFDILLPSGAGTGNYLFTPMTEKVFTVNAAGTYKYYVNMRMRTGQNSSDEFLNLSMTATYYPKAYGTVSKNSTQVDVTNTTGEPGIGESN